jgi:predicted transcriptional regulator
MVMDEFNPAREELTPQQQQVLDMLAAGRTITDIAAELGIGQTTIYNWKRSAVFNRAWEDLLVTLWESVKVGLKSAGGLAIKTLIDIMQNRDSSDRDKLTASQTVLANLHKVVTDDELRKRIEVLIDKMEE